MVSVAKKSKDKISIGGRKYALRRPLTRDGVAEAEVVGIGEPPVDDGDDRSLLVPLVRDGEVVGRESLDDDARAARRRPATSCRLRPGSCPAASRCIPTEHLGGTCPDGAGPLRLLLRGARGGHLDDRAAAAGERGADRGLDRLDRPDATTGDVPGALPAARALRRQHRVAALHQHREVRRPLGLAVVMPQVQRSFYADEAHGARYLTFLSEELPEVVQSFFRVSRRREDTFVAGLSMGGYGALKWALRQPAAVRRGGQPLRRAGPATAEPARTSGATAVRAGLRRRHRPPATTCSRCSAAADVETLPVALRRLRHRGRALRRQRAVRRRGDGRRGRRAGGLPARRARVGAVGRDDPRRARLAAAGSLGSRR